MLFTVPEPDLTGRAWPPRAGRTLRGGGVGSRTSASCSRSGVLQTLDNQIDTATGTLKLKARSFANADEKLFPNQFVNVRLQVCHAAGCAS